MLVKELIEELTKLPMNSLVVISKDSEGNSFSPLADYTECSYRANNTWSGEIGLTELTPELEELGYSEEDVMEDGVHAICLWPNI